MREFVESWLGYKAPARRQAAAIGVLALLVILLFVAAGLVDEVEGIVGGVLGLGVGIALLLGAAALYFIPAYLARKKRNASTVLVINIFFGWTFVGWVIALAMAVSDSGPRETPAARPTSLEHHPGSSGGRTCPFCAEDIKPAAIVCKHCGRDLPPVNG